MTSSTSRLESVPQEVLEHIAFCAATRERVGPPSGLLPLLLTCRNIHQALSFEVNPYLYARIFNFQFDTRSAVRRLGSRVNVPRVLAKELTKRWIHLKRIRARKLSLIRHAGVYPTGPVDLLWLAYLMMLENDGMNERQLLDYAEMDAWLMEYWFGDWGTSLAVRAVRQDTWPDGSKKNAIAMWLLWFLFRPDSIPHGSPQSSHMMHITKLIALAALQYPICSPAWTELQPGPQVVISPSFVTHFSETYRLNPPTLGCAAILVFLELDLGKLLPVHANYAPGYSLRSPASRPPTMRRSEDWDTDWYRCVSIARSDQPRAFSETYILGSMEGVWEGVFAYTEFQPYLRLLAGGPPSVLDNCVMGYHRQTWRLREYYLAEDQESNHQTLGLGDPLTAHFATKTRFQEFPDRVQVREPGKDMISCWRSGHVNLDGRRVTNVILLGEGHSAWGQFNVYGRVRPLDGLISVSKEYSESQRGRWLYRGFLVGNTDGHISGRWRDTVTPVDVEGYEGCFVMGRRQ